MLSITSKQDITVAYVDYLHAEAVKISMLDETSIGNLVNKELFDPETQPFLEEHQDIIEANSTGAMFNDEAFNLNFHHARLAAHFNLTGVRDWFKKLWDIIRKILCDILRDGTVISISDIIKKVIEEIMDMLGTVPGFVFRLIAAIVGKLIKLGVDSLCPVPARA